MLSNLLASMSIKYGEETTTWITTRLVQVAVGVLHVRAVGTILVLGVSVFLYAGGILDMPSHILGTATDSTTAEERLIL